MATSVGSLHILLARLRAPYSPPRLHNGSFARILQNTELLA